MNEPIDIIAFRETIRQFLFVLPYATMQITRHADIEAARPRGKNIHVVLLVHDPRI